jgi:hypothetical protein
MSSGVSCARNTLSNAASAGLPRPGPWKRSTIVRAIRRFSAFGWIEPSARPATTRSWSAAPRPVHKSSYFAISSVRQRHQLAEHLVGRLGQPT